MNSPDDEQYERKQNNDSYTFVFIAKNGKPIGRSESYTSSQARENGINAVKRDASDAVEI